MRRFVSSSFGLQLPLWFTSRNENHRSTGYLFAATLLLLVVTVNLASAQNAYDHFAYPTGSVNGQNGGAGWAGPWVGNGDTVVAPGLSVTCNGLAPSGNALGPTVGGASSRALATPITGAPGTSVVLSAVVYSNVNGGTFTQATLGNSSGGTFIIGELPETDGRAANWTMQNDAGVYYSSQLVVANTATCLVARIDFEVSSGLDRMRLWINPPSPIQSVSIFSNADIDVTTAHVPAFSGVFWQTQQGQAVDEISVNYAGGTWSKLNNPFPEFTTDQALLLTDGSVLVNDYGAANWYKFTPDVHGDYVNGSWSQVSSIPSSFKYNPFSFPSAVLIDGRVIVEGGEYNFNGTSLNHGAVYDPVSDSWTQVLPPQFGDTCDEDGNPGAGTYWCEVGESPSLVLVDGSFMTGNAGYTSSNVPSRLEALLRPPYNGPWIQTGFGKKDGNTEGGATLLLNPPLLAGDPTLSVVMTVDTYHGEGRYGTLPTPVCPGYPPGSPGWHSSEIFVRNAGVFNPGFWFCLGDTEVQLWAQDPVSLISADEMGPAVLRPDGTVFQAGANANSATAILSTSHMWSAGPYFPRNIYDRVLTIEDGPAALLPNGNVLMAATPGRDTPPATFFELTPEPANILVDVPGVSYADNLRSSYGEMLILPTGQIWFTPNRGSDYGVGPEIYTPANPTYQAAWAPHISCVSAVCFRLVSRSRTNTITGTGFNGMSQGAAFGDEFQSATNYPLVRITDLSTPANVYYCRTHDHSQMGVATGSTSTTTHFDCPNVPVYTLGLIEVVANGIPSNRQYVFVGP